MRVKAMLFPVTIQLQDRIVFLITILKSFYPMFISLLKILLWLLQTLLEHNLFSKNYKIFTFFNTSTNFFVTSSILNGLFPIIVTYAYITLNRWKEALVCIYLNKLSQTLIF